MKNLVIIEDETFAAEHLKRLLLEALPGSRVVAVMQSIEEAVEYFEGIDAAKVSGELAPDLAFVDIHLADGSAFRIFDRVVVPCPVVFTTAYDQYAQDAFQAGSIDYLLKPIDKEALNRTIGKIRSLGALGQGTLAQQLAKAMRQPRSRRPAAWPKPLWFCPCSRGYRPPRISTLPCGAPSDCRLPHGRRPAWSL